MHEAYLFKTVSKNIVRLVNTAHNSGGTGFVVKAPSGKLYTLTNEHVCDLGKETGSLQAVIEPKSYLADNRFVSLRIIEKAKDTDLCILEAVPGLTGLTLGSQPEIGDNVNIVGHPFLEPRTLTRGQVTSFSFITIALDYNLPETECVDRGGASFAVNDAVANFFGIMSICEKDVYAARTTASAFPGNSGSPVVNIYGNVVGALFAGNNATHFGYIVPLSSIKEFLRLY
jgi:S1-C subfamily serine protease